MKKIFLAAFLFILINGSHAQVQFDALAINPKMPKASQTINFKFNATLSSLIDAKKVDVVVYLFNKNGFKVVEPKVLQAGKTYSGSFKTEDNTDCIAFGFSADKEKDVNGGKGYIVPIYNEKIEPVKGYYAAANNLQNGYGEYLFGMATDAAKGLTYLEEGIKQYPDLKNDGSYFGNYLRAINTAKKKEAPALILNELQQYESKGNLTEADYNILIQWYARDKRKEKVDSLTAAMKAVFPEGTWQKNEVGVKFSKEKDVTKKLAYYQEYIAKYPPTADNKALIDNFKSQLANAYAKAKDYKAYSEWNSQLDKATMASNDNNISWGMAEADDNIEEAKKMSASATAYAKAEMLNPTEKKPETATAKQWNERRKSQYAMYADTYAYIMYKTGDYKTGYPYAKDAAAINENKNAEYNERYSLLLEKVMPAPTAKKEIEQFVKDGAASSKTKEVLKQLYIKEKKSDNGYDDYLTKLEMAAKLKKKDDLAKTMLNEAAPKFALEDLDGKTVSLESLKGKVVIVDFWATWCGPCIASMPAMKTVQEKLKGRNDVVFVFVDTWQTEENKKANAAEFMKKNNYPFHVLLDTEDKVVSDFKVSGIPTKFIIDKTGNIRFKSVGFGGNDDALVDEVDMMVDMASSDAPPARKYVK